MNTNGHFHLPNYELHHPRHSPEYRVLTNTSLQWRHHGTSAGEMSRHHHGKQGGHYGTLPTIHCTHVWFIMLCQHEMSIACTETHFSVKAQGCLFWILHNIIKHCIALHNKQNGKVNVVFLMLTTAAATGWWHVSLMTGLWVSLTIMS